MDMSQFSKDTPAQARERLQWILDVVRENQQDAGWILIHLSNDHPFEAMEILNTLKPMDRDALLRPNGILTDEQIELLK